jgi:hypothetical protein
MYEFLYFEVTLASSNYTWKDLIATSEEVEKIILFVRNNIPFKQNKIIAILALIFGPRYYSSFPPTIFFDSEHLLF